MLCLLVVLLLTGCTGDTGRADLDRYMAEVRARPIGEIEPVPEFAPYQYFSYGASGLRSPFEAPKKVLERKKVATGVKPDPNRIKEYLEQFDIASFTMVGTISNNQSLWGLLRGEDGIHRVKVGDYLGRNHGRITQVDPGEIQLLEIMPVGPGHWVERPRRIPLMEAGASKP